MAAITLADGPEFERIRTIIASLGKRGDGLGGDVGFLDLSGRLLAVSTDVSVEGIHFRRAWLSPEEIGWRATAAALSDLAAAGASALGILVALTMPVDERPEVFAEIMRGADQAAAAVDGILLGGDLSQGEKISVAVTVIGAASRRLTRAGARPGDSLWITGTLGGPRAALEAWLRGADPEPSARARFARPEPRLAYGRWLADQGASAMIDLSDGLGSDAPHLAAASKAALSFDLSRVPQHAAVALAARGAGEAPELFAAAGGEDYELLVAMPPEFVRQAPFELTHVGEVAAGAGVTFILDGHSVVPARYDHFA